MIYLEYQNIWKKEIGFFVQSTTDKQVNSYSNFQTVVHIGYNGTMAVCTGVSTPFKNATPTFLLSPPLNLETVQASPFQAILPYIVVFCDPPPPP